MQNKIYTSNCSKRVMAFCLDLVFIVTTILVTGFSGQYITVIGAYVLCAIILLLYVIIPVLIKGDSLGRIISKLHVVSINDQEISKAHSLFRECFKFILSFATFGVYAALSGLIVLKRKDELAIHDMIFKTHIINLELNKKIEDNKYKEAESFNTDSISKL